MAKEHGTMGKTGGKTSDGAPRGINAQHWIDGKWVDGNPALMNIWSHAIWMGAAIFDGARAFEGVTPDLDLHCQRGVRSAELLGLRSPMSWQEIQAVALEGIAKFPKDAQLYIRPFMWSEDGFIEPDPDSTRIAISVVEAALTKPGPMSVTLSKWRRPTPESAPTQAKAVAHYAQAGRATAEAKAKGFNDSVVLDMLGNVAEFSCSNLWIAKDGVAITPVANGCFLNGITRQRLIKLFQKAGHPVREATLTYQDVLDADEVFSSGNFAKVLPVTRIETRDLQPGPVYRRARELYWDFAHGK
ncbi:MAG: branched-chain amino acid aminotransferase [Dongiaceae bacterium]